MTYKGVRNTFVICGIIAGFLLLLSFYRIFIDYGALKLQDFEKVEFDIENYSIDEDVDSIEFQINAYADKVFYVEAYDKFDIDLFHKESGDIMNCFAWVDGRKLHSSDKYVNIYGFQVNESTCLSIESSRQYFRRNIVCDVILMIIAVTGLVFSVYVCTGKRYYNIR
ncbi:MAG: hypothetical protein ACI4D3_13185 [Lachnospiraceae bacterium]